MIEAVLEGRQPSPRLVMTRAVVFAYHNVGVRCLEVLIRHGVEGKLVVTHDDNPGETIWFERWRARRRSTRFP
jgi:methionyl-tRNA formyltransferase